MMLVLENAHLFIGTNTAAVAMLGSTHPCFCKHKIISGLCWAVRYAALQLVCLLVGDPVPHRCQWPGSAHLTVNGSRVPLKLAKRMHSQKLKPMQVGTARLQPGCVLAVPLPPLSTPLRA